MSEAPTISEVRPSDCQDVLALYPAVFPEEDLVPLVRALFDSGATSFVARLDDTIVAHAAITACMVPGHSEKVALLGPVAVAPTCQRQGIGSAIIKYGLSQLETANVARVFVLGDPNYYGRLGFKAERHTSPPHDLPLEWDGAWQSVSLGGHQTPHTGTLSVPPAWQDRSLWSE